MECMLHVIFHPHLVDDVEKTGGGMTIQAGRVSKLNIPPKLGTEKSLAGAFFRGHGPLFHAIHLSPRKLHPVLRAERAKKDRFATGQKTYFFGCFMNVILDVVK